MAILEIRVNDDPILKEKSTEINAIDDELKNLVDDMFETMQNSDGLGLAAPQIGISKRLIVADIEAIDPDCPPIALINPIIIEKSEMIELGEEGCLSLPNFRAMIRRSADVVVEGVLPNGDLVEIETSGLMARVLQHEIDHLDGILITDRLLPEDQGLLTEKEKINDEEKN